MALCLIIFWISCTFAISTFGTNDPLNWGTLDRSMLSSSALITNDWTSYFYISYFGCERRIDRYNTAIATCENSHAQIAASLFFFSLFMILGMMLLRMFLGMLLLLRSRRQRWAWR